MSGKHWLDYEQLHPSEGHCDHCHPGCQGGLQYRSVGAVITHSHVNGPPQGRYTIEWNMRDGQTCPICDAINAEAERKATEILDSITVDMPVGMQAGMARAAAIVRGET